MAKTGLILSDPDDPSQTFRHSGSTMQDGVVKIVKTFYFKVPDGENPRDYSDIDVYNHLNFPQMMSAFSDDARYKFYGNAQIAKQSADSRYFRAECEYSTRNPHATDSDGGEVNSDTPPWKLRPDNIRFTHPEIVVPFTAAYNSTGELYEDSGKKDSLGNVIYNAVNPVVNSAGDIIPADTAKKFLQMSFTYATRTWSMNNLLNFGNSINVDEIKVCGLPIPAGKALLLTPEVDYITVYHDNSNRIKWEYWSVNITIQIDTSDLLLTRKMLNIGNRAFFAEIKLQDDLLTKEELLPGTDTLPSQICMFRKAKKTVYEFAVEWNDNGDPTKTKKKTVYFPTGEKVFCSWAQYLAAREMYLKKSGGEYDCQCEQLTDMPLTETGHLDMEAIEQKKPYETLSFREFPSRSWSSLNIPRKGIDWN